MPSPCCEQGWNAKFTRAGSGGVGVFRTVRACQVRYITFSPRPTATRGISKQFLPLQ